MDPKGLNDFKNWLSNNSNKEDISNFFELNEKSTINPLIGRNVIPKVSANKISQKIECNEEDPTSLILDFMEDGGTIVGVDGKMLEIEVTQGSFHLPKFCVKLD